MDFKAKLKPLNEEHSIKEAVISLFLPNKLIKPEQYRDLIKNNFRDDFQQFQPVNQVKFEIKQGHKQSIIQTNHNTTIGFRFIGFSDNGNPVKVFQGINEENRQFISFHSLNYTRWSEFKKEFFHVLEIFSKESKGIYFEAFSLNYIDIFSWEDEPDNFKSEYLFQQKSNILPEVFLNSGFNRSFLVTTENIEDSLLFNDRIEIIAKSEVSPEIILNHNSIHKLEDTIEISEISTNNDFLKRIEIAHDRNKKFLKDVLSEHALSLINYQN